MQYRRLDAILPWAGLVAFTGILYLFAAENPGLALMAVAGLFVALVFFRKPEIGLSVMIVLLPYLNTKFLNQQIAGIPGLKISNLLMLLVLAAFLWRKRIRSGLTPVDCFFLIGTLSLFFISVLRSTQYMNEWTLFFYNETYNPIKYMLSHWLVPTLNLVPFVIAFFYIRSDEEISTLCKSLQASMLLLSVVIFYIYVFMVPNKGVFSEIRMLIGAELGMHGNNIVDFYIIAFPILMIMLFKERTILSVVSIALSVAAVGILFSRAAYAIVLVSVFATMFISRRNKHVPVVLIGMIVLVLLLPDVITQRATTGFDTRDINDITAGRYRDIWLPLINEVLRQPFKILFGAGRYGLIDTMVFKNALILQVGHAHNMYLDMFFDAGLVGFVFFVWFYLSTALRTWRNMRFGANGHMFDLLSGVLASLGAYLVRGMTDSFFFPALTNSYMWLVLGLALALGYRNELGQTSKMEDR